MGRVVSVQTNFTKGAIDPLMRSRIDLQHYYNALESATNVLIHPQGGMTRRPGLQWIFELPSAASPQNGCRLIPFEFSTTQNYLLIFVHQRMYVIQNGVKLTNINGSGNDYLVTTITSAMLGTMDWTQSADTLLLVQEDMTPFQVVRGGSHTTWTISAISFDWVPKYAFTLATSQPNATLTPSAAEGKITMTAGSSVFIADHVNQYVEADNGYGRGRIVTYNSGTEVEVDTIVPWFNTDAIAANAWTLETGYEDAWSNSKGYPRTVTFHEGRLFFGGVKSAPNVLFGSRVSQYFNFNPGEALDDESLEFTLTTDAVNPITGLMSGRDLQIFTSGAEFFVPQGELDPITPTTLSVKPTTRQGHQHGIPLVVSEAGTLFMDRSGKNIREFVFSDAELSYVSNDITLWSSHLLLTPVDMALRKSISSALGDVLHVVNSAGTMAVYSLMRSEKVVAASQYTTGASGAFFRVGVDQGDVYVVVKRTINSATKYYVERVNDDFTTDCGLQFTSAAGNLPGSTTLSGLTHLEGQTLNQIVDDVVYSNVTVSSGAVTLGAVPSTYVEVGIPYSPSATTMPLEVQLKSGHIQGTKRRVVEATVAVESTQSLALQGEALPFRSFPYTLGTAVPAFTGDKEAGPFLGYGNGQVTVTIPEPLFATVAALFYKVSIGEQV